MKQAFQYQDDKSNKFWWIDFEDTELVVNFGKKGTIGRYQGKYFDTAEECEKEAKKLISSKIKKGYIEHPDFDFENHLYFDDEEEIGLSPMTSHPRFVAHFTDPIYYSPGDEEAPFGSDEGHDALSSLFELVRKKKALAKIMDFPKQLIVDDWGMDYIPPTVDTVNEQAVKELLPKEEENGRALYQSDKVIMATAFGMIKISGQITMELRALALLSMQRISIYDKLKGYEVSEIHNELIADLKAFL